MTVHVPLNSHGPWVPSMAISGEQFVLHFDRDDAFQPLSTSDHGREQRDSPGSPLSSICNVYHMRNWYLDQIPILIFTCR